MSSGGIPAPARRVTAQIGTAEKDDRDSRRPRRGRPRSEEADRAILSAAIGVLASRGVGGMSIEEVASRAGVGKATIYRRWSSKGTLALDAYLSEMHQWPPTPDTGSLHEDLRLMLQSWVRLLTTTSAGSIIVGLIAEKQYDAELASSWHERLVQPSRRQYTVILNRAINRGEIAADTDQDHVLDILYGSVTYRMLHADRPLNDEFVDAVVSMISAGIKTLRS
jgi:AcrR family transcriptional regulator